MKHLKFKNHSLDPVPSDDGQVWIRYRQISDALGYKHWRDLNYHYNHHENEFTPSMTRLIKVRTSGGGLQNARVFSLRGAHLLAMFSRTPVAAEFRRWVLDILDREAVTTAVIPAKAGIQAIPALSPAARHEVLRIAQLENALLKQRPDWRAILRYIDLGLNHTEIGRLLLVSKDTVRRRLLEMSECGLAFYVPSPGRVENGRIGGKARWEKAKALADSRQAQLALEG